MVLNDILKDKWYLILTHVFLTCSKTVSFKNRNKLQNKNWYSTTHKQSVLLRQFLLSLIPIWLTLHCINHILQIQFTTNDLFPNKKSEIRSEVCFGLFDICLKDKLFIKCRLIFANTKCVNYLFNILLFFWWITFYFIGHISQQ